MKKVLYYLSGLQEWLGVAEKMRNDYSWDPVYWITYPQLSGLPIKIFPEVIEHSAYDANRGVYPEELADLKFPLDKDLIKNFSHHEKIVMKMSDRLDPQNVFTYHERKRLYYSLLEYWLAVLKKLSIDIVLFTETPHFPSQYVCYIVCKYYNIQTLMFSSTTFQGLLFIKDNYENVPSIEINISEDNRNTILEIIEKYINISSADYSVAIPWYMIKQQKKDSRQRNVFIYLASRMQIIYKQSRVKNAYKKNGYLIEKSDYKPWEEKKLKHYLNKKTGQLKKFYFNISEDVSLDNNYIYFPLHYQPERTSAPEGDVYVDQLLAINLLSYYLPEGWYIYVKEHPSQFMYGMKGNMGRSFDFYLDIKKNFNVKLINYNHSPFEIIDNAKAVVTLTGSAGLEGILRGKPAILFGYAWYRNCPGAYYVSNSYDVEKTLIMIRNGININQNAVKTYLHDMKKYFLRGYLYPSSKLSIDLNYEEHVNELYLGLKSYIENNS